MGRKFFGIMILCLMTRTSYGIGLCDIGPGYSAGVKVIKFITDHNVLSKISLRDSSPEALIEEMNELQEMGLCLEAIPKKKCVLRLEKNGKLKSINMYRGEDKFYTWDVKNKTQATQYVVAMRKKGFCK